jgi:hypothetical protein
MAALVTRVNSVATSMVKVMDLVNKDIFKIKVEHTDYFSFSKFRDNSLNLQVFKGRFLFK